MGGMSVPQAGGPPGSFEMVRPPGHPAWPEQQLLQQSYALRPGGLSPSLVSMPLMPQPWAPGALNAAPSSQNMTNILAGLTPQKYIEAMGE